MYLSTAVRGSAGSYKARMGEETASAPIREEAGTPQRSCGKIKSNERKTHTTPPYLKPPG